MTNVIRGRDGFFSSNKYCGDSDSVYIHKKQWSTLVEKGYIRKLLGFGKNNSGKSRIFNHGSWKKKYCLVIN